MPGFAGAGVGAGAVAGLAGIGYFSSMQSKDCRHCERLDLVLKTHWSMASWAVVPLWPLAEQELTLEKQRRSCSQSAADLVREHCATTLSKESPVVVPVTQNEMGPKHLACDWQASEDMVVRLAHFLMASTFSVENWPLAMQFSTRGDDSEAKRVCEKFTMKIKVIKLCRLIFVIAVFLFTV